MLTLTWLWIFYISATFCLQKGVDKYIDTLELCKHNYQSCASGSKHVACNCDQVCIYYDNCCFDADLRETDKDDKHLHYLNMTTCEPIAFRENKHITMSAFMISSCPASWNGDVDTRNACEHDTLIDVRDILPVVDIKTNLTFKNRHCAECHKVKQYFPWLLNITCLIGANLPRSHSVIGVVMKKIVSDHCTYHFIPPKHITIHHCYLEFDFTIISDTFVHVNNLTCRNRVFSPVVTETFMLNNNTFHYQYFRNLQCLINHIGVNPEVLETTFCVTRTSRIINKLLSRLSALIDFSSLISSQQKMRKCNDGEVLLPHQVGCHRLYCPANSESSGDECVDINHTTDGLILDLLFEIHGEAIQQVSAILQTMIDSLITVLRTHTHTFVKYKPLLLRSLNMTQGNYLNNRNSCIILQLNLPITGIIHSFDDVESLRSLTSNFIDNYTIRDLDDSDMKHIPDIQILTCITNTTFRNPLYLMEIDKIDNDLPCPAVKLQFSGNRSDNEVMLDDVLNGVSEAYFHLNGIMVSPLDIVLANREYFLCVETFLLKYKSCSHGCNYLNEYRDIVNIACTSISITCMVYCLVQFFGIPTLREGKSDLSIVLVLTLLLAQTCFLIMSHLAILNNDCQIVGMIHHFLWLSAFAFMFLSSYRLNVEVRDLKLYTKLERSRATVKYIFVGYSLPLFVVGCTKITYLFLEPTESWYGGRLCFISQTVVLLFSFVIPVVLILCGNMFLLISIIRYISSTSISQSSNKTNVIVFIKISSIMGFSWAIGIVAILSQSEILLLIFEVLSNLQGAFITISLSCTNRVKQFYKQCGKRVKVR